MSVWTGSPERTVALEISFAYWTIGRDAMAVGLEEEWRKGEFVLWSLMLEDLARQVFGTRPQRENACRHWRLDRFRLLVLFDVRIVRWHQSAILIDPCIASAR